MIFWNWFYVIWWILLREICTKSGHFFIMSNVQYWRWKILKFWNWICAIWGIPLDEILVQNLVKCSILKLKDLKFWNWICAIWWILFVEFRQNLVKCSLCMNMKANDLHLISGSMDAQEVHVLTVGAIRSWTILIFWTWFCVI